MSHFMDAILPENDWAYNQKLIHFQNHSNTYRVLVMSLASRCFKITTTFHPQNKQMRLIVLLSPFYRWSNRLVRIKQSKPHTWSTEKLGLNSWIFWLLDHGVDVINLNWYCQCDYFMSLYFVTESFQLNEPKWLLQ